MPPHILTRWASLHLGCRKFTCTIWWERQLDRYRACSKLLQRSNSYRAWNPVVGSTSSAHCASWKAPSCIEAEEAGTCDIPCKNYAHRLSAAALSQLCKLAQHIIQNKQPEMLIRSQSYCNWWGQHLPAYTSQIHSDIRCTQVCSNTKCSIGYFGTRVASKEPSRLCISPA